VRIFWTVAGRSVGARVKIFKWSKLCCTCRSRVVFESPHKASRGGNSCLWSDFWGGRGRRACQPSHRPNCAIGPVPISFEFDEEAATQSTIMPCDAGGQPPLGSVPVSVYDDHGWEPKTNRQTLFAIGVRSLHTRV
jgi:hypothetical protein